MVADLLESSLRFQEVVETLEVQLDKKTLRRLKAGDREYKKGKFKVTSTKEEIDRVLSGSVMRQYFSTPSSSNSGSCQEM